MEYLKTPQDKLYIATPVAFCKESPLLLQYLKLLASTVMDPSVDLAKVEWVRMERSSEHPFYNIAMQALGKAFRDHGLDCAIAKSVVCTAFPYSLGQSLLNAAKNHLCKLEGGNLRPL